MAVLKRRAVGRAVVSSLVVLCLLASPTVAQSDNSPNLEAQVKAAFLYNFAKFVEWPLDLKGPDAPFVIGVLGKGQTLTALKKLEGQEVRGRRVEVRSFSRASEADCHVLFLDASRSGTFAEELAELKGRPILTVGDGDEFLSGGGMIALVRIAGNIRYRVRKNPADLAHLTISSKLLKLADRVVE